MTIEIANSIPIFDTLSHPTLNGNWLNQSYDGQATISKSVIQMSQNNICGTFAVGMQNIGGYNEDDYLKYVKTGGG